MRSLLLACWLVLSLPGFARAANPAPLPDDPAATAEDHKFMQRAIELVRDTVAHGTTHSAPSW